MKRTGRILSLILAVIMIVSCFSFASALTLNDTYPKQDTTGAAIENFGIKLYFDSELSADVLGKTNDHCFTLKDEAGHNLPILVLYSPKEVGVVMVLFDSAKKNLDKEGKQITIQGDTEYTLTISSSLRDNLGDDLGVDKVIKFKTLNQKKNMAVNMILMAVLYAGIIIFSIRSAKKQGEKEAQKGNAGKAQTVNPYKEAKRTGKSVAEIVEQDQKNKAKAQEKAQKKALKDKADEDEWEYLQEGHYLAGKPRTVASAGSTYKTGRKALAEKRKAEEEARKLQQAEWDKKKKGKGKKK